MARGRRRAAANRWQARSWICRELWRPVGRHEKLLAVRVRFRNTGSKSASINLADAGRYDENYITAAEKQYPVVRDSNGHVVATPMNPGGELSADIAKGGTWNWWAKFPAPLPVVKAYTLYLNVGPRIGDVPIVDQ